MSKDHLHILHLPPTTPDDKINKVCQERYGNLMSELINQGITSYTIWEGEYNPKNTKEAISKGWHRMVQYAKDNNLPSIICCEDDIKFTHPNSYQYFLSQIPKSYDLFFGLIYAGEIKDNRVVNGFSGGMTLISIHSRFYDTFLSLPINAHVDREAGNLSHKYEFYLCEPQVVTQRGGYSFNLKRTMFYHEYLRGKVMYNG